MTPKKPTVTEPYVRGDRPRAIKDSGSMPSSGGPTAKPAVLPQLEPLESRVLLAGNVTAVVAGGNLLLTGDAAANQVRVDQAFGYAADQFRVTPAGGTAVNGANTIEIDDGDFTGKVSLLAGKGGDTIRLDTKVTPAGVPTYFRDRLTLKTGAEADAVAVGSNVGGDDVRCYSTSLFDGGSASDNLVIWGTNDNVFDVAPTIRNFEGVF